MSGPRTKRSPEYQRAAVRFATILRTEMRARSLTRDALAAKVGVSGTMIGYYTRARYLPRPDIAEKLADVLDSDALAKSAAEGRRIRCAVCGRTTWRGVTRRRYCSDECWAKGKDLHPNGATAERAAIDAFCMGCEPGGLCRTPDCVLQPFSPLPLIQLGRNGAA